MNELKVFENKEFGPVRAAEINGDPWFSGKDIADRLGYSNTKDALSRHVDEEDKKVFQRSEFTTLENHLPKDVFPCEFVDANIPNRGITMINESGVYSLILRSNLPKAKEFKRWITSEVLPSIRKNGGYINGQETMTDDELMAAALIMAQKKIEERDKQIAEMKPKALFADCVTASETSMLVRDFAKMVHQKTNISIGGGRMWEWLRKKGYICKWSCMPTQRSMEMGLFEIEERAITDGDSIRLSQTTKITGKGQRYFFQKLLEDYGYDTGRNQVQ